MKKTFILFISVIALVSCGKDKSVPSEAKQSAPADKYGVEIEATYEKDDSIVAFYQKQGYYQYDRPVSVLVKGAPGMQKIMIDFPEGEPVENIKITASTNKAQEYLTIKNISVKNNGKVTIDGDSGKHAEYFATDEGFSWDEKNSRYKLDHTKKYPPSLVGNEALLSLMVK